MLTGISGCLEMLQTRLNQGRTEDLERYLVTAQSAARRAASLTRRLLAFSRRQTLSPEVTDVSRLMAAMKDLIGRTIGPSVTVETIEAGGLWNTMVDHNHLENVLLNLCINARDAMPCGGHLTIETANRWLDESAARSLSMTSGPYISLCVSDTGTGMTPEVIRHAFEPFFTTKAARQGTGLGLWMIHDFARQSGGQVQIHSVLGQGSRVCIYLPRYDGNADSKADPTEPAQPLPAGLGGTVLVVDDEPGVRMLISDVLEEMGYAAIEAVEGSAALKVLRSDIRIDLLITDVGLPGGMDGCQLAAAARQCRPDLKVLFITGYFEDAVIGSLETGMHVLTKPFVLAHLASRIKGMCNSPGHPFPAEA